MSIYGAPATDYPHFDDEARHYDALLLLSYGGPEAPGDVMPFLANATAGRNVPPFRLEEVAEHYLNLGGISPINAQNRALIAALEEAFLQLELKLPVYFGNRNWMPFVTDTVRQMQADGVRRAAVFVTSAFGSYSGCRQYGEDLIRAVEAVGPNAPHFDKIRLFFNHPGFIGPMTELTQAALHRVPASERATTRLIFTAHSIPLGMAHHCAYEMQFREASRLIAAGVGAIDHDIAYQSRSGPPYVPWLEPDILDVLETVKTEGATGVVVVPAGFISDHMEVIFDLDTEAAAKARELGLRFERVPTVGVHPGFVDMICKLIIERQTAHPERLAAGQYGPTVDFCPRECCFIGSERLRTAKQPA